MYMNAKTHNKQIIHVKRCRFTKYVAFNSLLQPNMSKYLIQAFYKNLWACQ